MNEINIAEADIADVAEGIRKLGPDVRGFGTVDPAWTRPPAVLVIDCVLSLNRRYDAFVVPRLSAFMEKHHNIQKVTDLAYLMDSFQSPNAFLQQELNYNHEERAYTLQSVVEFLCSIVKKVPTITEEEAFRHWAIQAKPEEYQKMNIKGFGIAGFQYLRMLFGADTTKPDVHIIRFVSEILDRKVSGIEALDLLEASSGLLGLSVRDVDAYIWDIRARQKLETPGTNITETDEMLYSDFWLPILQGNLGKLFAGKPTTYHKHGWMMGKKIQKVEIWFRLTNRKCYIRLYFLRPNPLERRDKIMELFPETDYEYEYKDTSSQTTVIFPVLEKGKNDRDDWDEIREKLVTMATDIYKKINESGL